MSHRQASSHPQEVIEAVEVLPPDDQAVLIHVIRQHLIQWQCTELDSIQQFLLLWLIMPLFPPRFCL